MDRALEFLPIFVECVKKMPWLVVVVGGIIATMIFEKESEI